MRYRTQSCIHSAHGRLLFSEQDEVHLRDSPALTAFPVTRRFLPFGVRSRGTKRGSPGRRSKDSRCDTRILRVQSARCFAPWRTLPNNRIRPTGIRRGQISSERQTDETPRPTLRPRSLQRAISQVIGIQLSFWATKHDQLSVLCSSALPTDRARRFTARKGEMVRIVPRRFSNSAYTTSKGRDKMSPKALLRP